MIKFRPDCTTNLNPDKMKRYTFKKIEGGILAFVVVLLVAACHAKKQSDERNGYAIEIHRYASPAAGIFSNAYYIELEKSVVVIDATLINSTSKALKSKIDSLQKSISAVLLTHGHPDHYNGLGNLLSETGQVPVYSTQEVFDVIKEYDAAKAEQWTPMFGDEWPVNRMFPNTIVAEGERIKIDGAEFTVRKLGPGESHADSYWLLEYGGKQYAFIGDAVLQGVHAYMADGHFVEWLQNLTRLEKELSNVHMIYPGHGVSGATELLTWQKRYIREYVSNVDELLGNKDRLSEEDKEELVIRMKKFLPSENLEFLIGLAADVVASRLKELKTNGELDEILN